jgi:FxsC-like protein
MRHLWQTASRMPPPQDFVYFLSYARDDFYVRGSEQLEEEPYLRKFFADLREAVRSKAGRLQAERVDFRDTEQIALGQQWRDVVLDGLQNCRTMVALFTPTFFTRPECGVELGFMQLRRRHTYAEGTQPHDFIIPVVWEPGSVPPPLKGINYFYAKLPASYKQYGLRVLARNKNFEADYEQAVQALALQIDAVRQMKPALPSHPNPPNPSALSTPFVSAPAAGGAPAQAAAVKGPNGVRFAYVAASQAEIVNKQHVAPYGARGEEWQPSAADDRTIGMIAPAVAGTSKFIPYQLALDASIEHQVKQAAAENALIVLLVDVWSACRIAKYRDLMAKYDEHTGSHCAALIVWNDQDPDIDAQKTLFEEGLEAIFQLNHSRGLPFFHKAIQTVGELETCLRETLERLRNDITTKAKAFRKLEALDGLSARPAISNVAPPGETGS